MQGGKHRETNHKPQTTLHTMKTYTRKIRKFKIGFSESEICLVHQKYREIGGKYGREGGFLNRGPEKAIDRDKWMYAEYEVKPEAFYS